MRKQSRKLLCLIALLYPVALLAQVQLSGTVHDSHNNPISRVSVRLLNTTIGTTTDNNGRFTLSAPGKTGQVEFSNVGYKTQTIALKNGADNITITLQDDVGGLDEVVITGIASTV